MKKIHLILNAHIDPIWLWTWQAGLDEILATCRSACDRLDTHPDIIFTRGEAWVYQQIEMIDPELFARITNHIQAGRWEIVGGWWIQPDCNQPSGWAMAKQIALGKQYFMDRFGQFPAIGYNVDSFGHAATLPALMQAMGQNCYIMMRPQEHEMGLPARLFRWRGYPDTPEVTTFRISSAYMTRTLNAAHLRAATENLPEGITDTMCFVGVGDHGGGPTEQQIAWCRENKHTVDGWELVFSSPSRFFASIEGQSQLLPLVTGELQMHAVGCYSAYRPVKTLLRRAEHLLAQAERAASDPHALSGTSDQLSEAWKEVCFHHFHDTLGGTCIPSAYQAVLEQLGSAASAAEKTIAYTLRRKLVSLPADPMQRIIVWNPAPDPFQGYIEFEPWTEGFDLGPDMDLLDNEGKSVPFQFIETEAAMGGLQRLLFHTALKSEELRTYKIVRHKDTKTRLLISADDEMLSNDTGISLSRTGMTFHKDIYLPRPVLDLIEDSTDTWSHGIDRYSDAPLEIAQWNAYRTVDQGPLMASWMEDGSFGDASKFIAEWRVYAGEPYVSLDLQVDFHEKHRVLKLTFPLPSKWDQRIDGILGGLLTRPNDGRELPLRDWTLIGTYGIVCPDIYAVDATADHLRLTLLRSPMMAHHEPHPGESKQARRVYSDQGNHRFRFRFYGDALLNPQTLESAALVMQRPPFCADFTRGMPAYPAV